MSGDEVFVTIASLLLGPIAWIFWFASVRPLTDFRAGSRQAVSAMTSVLIASGVIVLLTLWFAAADDVRNAPQYVFMYFLMGQAWVRVTSWIFPLLGLNPRDDLLERRNPAALPAWTGAMLGVTFCFAGGNIGNGPGWWVVVFAAGLATGMLAVAWTVIGRWTSLVDSVTIDRDPAAGWRLGGFLAAAGLVFGFAVTGDWVSASATVADFITRAWPIGPIAVAVFLLERSVRPTPERPRGQVSSAGVVPAVVFVAAAVAAVVAAWPRV
jgi:uncharacterized membrane protein YjfL (UPF0719 family)